MVVFDPGEEAIVQVVAEVLGKPGQQKRRLKHWRRELMGWLWGFWLRSWQELGRMRQVCFDLDQHSLCR